MKSAASFSPYFRTAASVVLAMISWMRPVIGAEETSAPKSTSTEEKAAGKHPDFTKDEIKNALAQLNVDLGHLSQLGSAAPSVAQKTELQVRCAILRERLNGLEKNFTQAGYESFKADLQVEKDKVSAWTKVRAEKSAVSATAATADRTAEKISAYRAEASDLNKEEAQAALARLDNEIQLLGAKIETFNDKTRKAELTQQLNALKDRRNDLNGEFRKARYDALVEDVKAIWNKAINAP